MTYPEYFWRDQFQQGVCEGAVMTPIGSGKALVGKQGVKIPEATSFSTLKSLTFD